MNAQTFRFDLRTATQDLHHRLDDSVGALTDARSYARYLRGLYAFRRWAEDSLPAALPFGDWHPTRAAAALADDLADLGLTAPTVPAPDRIDGSAALLGHLYVLEGAAIGARLLQRRALAIGYDGSHGARHLALQAGADRWHGFAQILMQSDPALVPAATLAARHAFTRALQTFQEA